MRGVPAALVLVLLAAPAAGSEFRWSVRLSSVQARDLARGMAREIEELSRKEEVERERYVQATAAIGAIMASFGKWAPGDKKAGAAVSELMVEFSRISEEHRKVADPLVLRIALRARQLEKYRKTGSLALAEGEIAEIQDALLHPRTAIPPAKPLPLDIVELRKYLDDWWKPAKDKGKKETLPPPAPCRGGRTWSPPPRRWPGIRAGAGKRSTRCRPCWSSSPHPTRASGPWPPTPWAPAGSRGPGSRCRLCARPCTTRTAGCAPARC